MPMLLLCSGPFLLPEVMAYWVRERDANTHNRERECVSVTVETAGRRVKEGERLIRSDARLLHHQRFLARALSEREKKKSMNFYFSLISVGFGMATDTNFGRALDRYRPTGTETGH
jgi:hypothetical protein